MILSVVFYIFVVCTVIQIIFLFSFTTFLSKSKRGKKFISETPVSVIVFAKNQGKNLETFLPKILEQQYKTFEVVIVNNASTDETTDIIETFLEKHNNIKIVNVENTEAFWASKKYALTLGIKASSFDHLLFTDTNCNPTSNFWIAEMSANFTNKKTIVLGYKKFKSEKTLLNIFIRFDNLLTAIKCFGFASKGASFMAFDSNFAYEKAEFFNVKGFINHIKIATGEADLFIKDAATKENTTFCISENSFIETAAPKSFSNWFSDKKKSTKIYRNYKFKHRFLLNLFTFTKLLFYILAIGLLFFYNYQIILLVALVYFITNFIVVGFCAKRLQEPKVIFFLPFLEISLLLFQISIFITNLTSKPNHWK